MLIDGRKYLTTLRENYVTKKFELSHLKFSRSGKARIELKIDDYVSHFEGLINQYIDMWALTAEGRDKLHVEQSRVQEEIKKREQSNLTPAKKAKNAELQK